MSFDPIPQARVVRKAGRIITGAPAPKDEPSRNSFAGVLRDMGHVALGMWPLTAVMLLILGLLVMAGNGNPYGH
ncbi:MAG: hypothetical protein H0V17_31565 [Deltaproteobacteria bacterium]|nr:hypothetical protein [Deltaproteobacteria bacterium]